MKPKDLADLVESLHPAPRKPYPWYVLLGGRRLTRGPRTEYATEYAARMALHYACSKRIRAASRRVRLSKGSALDKALAAEFGHWRGPMELADQLVKQGHAVIKKDP